MFDVSHEIISVICMKLCEAKVIDKVKHNSCVTLQQKVKIMTCFIISLNKVSTCTFMHALHVLLYSFLCCLVYIL